MPDLELPDSSDTVALTIEIDEDEQWTTKSDDKALGSAGPSSPYSIPLIRAPRTVDSVRITLPSTLRISQLSLSSKDVLSAHLQLPAFGSLRNWESVAAALGTSTDSIMSFRLQDKPLEIILDRYSDKPLNKLLIALEQAGRIDTLYSLKDLQRKGELLGNTPAATAKAASPRLPFAQNIHSISTSTALSFQPPGEPYILVTHYERSSDERKQFKWLMKNLRENELNMSGIPVLDMNNTISEENVVESIQDVFRQAAHIVVCFSPSYLSIDRFEGIDGDYRLIANQHLSRLMNTEFYQQNSQNKRFRPVVFPALGDVILPVGWPSSTIQYSFPTQAKKLFTRLFSGSQSMVTM